MATDLTDLLGSDNEEVEPQTDHPQASDLLSFEQITGEWVHCCIRATVSVSYNPVPLHWSPSWDC